VPGYSLDPWLGLFVPAKVPAEIVAKINADVVETLADDTVKKRLSDIGQEIWPVAQQTPAALLAQQQAEIERWWPVIKAAGIKGE